MNSFQKFASVHANVHNHLNLQRHFPQNQNRFRTVNWTHRVCFRQEGLELAPRFERRSWKWLIFPAFQRHRRAVRPSCMVQRATRHERKSSWQAATPHPRRRPIRRTFSPGMSPTRATRIGAAWFHRDHKGHRFNWKWFPSMAGSCCVRHGRRKEGTGRLAPGLNWYPGQSQAARRAIA